MIFINTQNGIDIMKLSQDTLRKKMLGCFLGKSAGGTLGQPYEGWEGPLGLTYYDPVPTDMIPNDDLDLQVLWADCLARQAEPVVDRDLFGRAWVEHVHFPWSEYGIAIRNLKLGIPATWSGRYDNWFKDGLGAAIRSEIWACLAPGNPELAAKFMREDAMVDHVGEGVNAAVFLAVLESAAFVESDMEKLLDTALAAIPAECGIARAVRDTRRWCAQNRTWSEVFELIKTHYGSEDFTNTVMNFGFSVMALLMGKGDFGKTVCFAVNCGKDADCTGATVGAILGLIDPEGIPEEWLRPIGRKLVLSPTIVGITPPATLDDFVEQLLSLRERVRLRTAPDAPEPDWSRFALTAECGLFDRWIRYDDRKNPPVMPEKTIRRTFPGSNGCIEASEVPLNALYLMRFRFHLAKPQRVRVMFCTASLSRVWVDGAFAFGRDGGWCQPSFHHCPINQFVDLDLAAGEHTLTAGVAPAGDEEEIRWTVGIGNAADFQWIPDALIY